MKIARWDMGHRCNSWRVISAHPISRDGRPFYRCQCECGATNLVAAWRLNPKSRNAVTQCRGCALKKRAINYASDVSCEYLEREYVEQLRPLSALAEATGCGLDALRRRLKQCGLSMRSKSSSPVHFLEGKSIGKWKVGKKVRKPRGRTSQVYYECTCECGLKSSVYANSLVSGHSRGCRKCATPATHASPHWKGCGDLSGTHWHKIVLEARKRALPVSITIAQAWRLFVEQEGKCALTGMRLRMRGRNSEEQRERGTASLDRIDSTKGYVPGNVQWVHKDVNLMKNEFAEEYLLRMCRLVVRKTTQKRDK
jgi:hypothetical protein